jgi:hypothetical protein
LPEQRRDETSPFLNLNSRNAALNPVKERKPASSHADLLHVLHRIIDDACLPPSIDASGMKAIRLSASVSSLLFRAAASASCE